MSLKLLQHAECFYFDRNPGYRDSIRSQLKEKGWPLRRMDTDNDYNYSTIGLDQMVKSRAKGYVPGRRSKVRRKEVALA